MNNEIRTLADVSPITLHESGDHLEVAVLDAESIAALVRGAAETYPDAPILSHLAKWLGDLSGLDARQVLRVGGAGYALRAEVRYDYDGESPRGWHNLSSLACFDSWSSGWNDLTSGSDEAITSSRKTALGVGVDVSPEDIRRTGGNSFETDEHRLLYRILHLDGARGIRNVGTARDGISHGPADPHDGLDHDAVAWIPRGAIPSNAPAPEGYTLEYSPATGWEYVSACGLSRLSAEESVSEWADQATAGSLGTLSQYLSGEIYGVCFATSTHDDEDDYAEEDDYSARAWDDTPDGDLWGIYGDTELDIARAGSTAFWQALEALESDLANAARFREAEQRTREAHAALLEDLDLIDPGTSDLLRTLWGARFRHITSHREIAKGLANEGLQLAKLASGAPALARLDQE